MVSGYKWTVIDLQAPEKMLLTNIIVANQDLHHGTINSFPL